MMNGLVAVKMYQGNLGFSNEEMAKKAKISVERYLELIDNCNNLTLEEAFNLALAIEAEIDLIINNVYLLPKDFCREINTLIEKEDADKLAYYVINDFIEFKDGNFYSLSKFNNKIIKSEIISEDNIIKLSRILLKNGYVDLVAAICELDNVLNISSLKDLDFAPQEYIEKYIYGSISFPFRMNYSLPKHFIGIVKNLNENDQRDVLIKANQKVAKTIIDFKNSLNNGSEFVPTFIDVNENGFLNIDLLLDVVYENNKMHVNTLNETYKKNLNAFNTEL